MHCAVMELRLATLEDADVTRRIYNFEVTRSTATFDLRPRTRSEHLRWIERHLGAHPAVVAVEQGVVTGFAAVSPYRERPAYATTVEDSVYVDQSWRGRGTGGALLADIVDRAADHGFHTVVARIEATNEASLVLHRRHGFTLVGTERQIGRKFGRWLDVTVLQLML
ncbi:MAG: GNAT family N-acetyltransferase [Actinomycetota bacterium]|jgi:phosphinothricin acetyltransferase|nr:GNAT family N-acetyltransferase [Actinomycetota bacterium]